MSWATDWLHAKGLGLHATILVLGYKQSTFV